MKLEYRILSTAIASLWVAAVISTAAQTATPAPAQAGKGKAASVKLPPVVAAAFKKAYPSATIKNISHETEDGVEQYEIESTNAGHGLDANYKPDGTLIVIEEEIAAADVPAAVTAAIAARYPKATITTRERATEKTRSYFEIGLKGAPVKEVQLTADGKWISPKPGK
jgi:hypothetical protein